MNARHIVVGIDGSSSAGQAVRWAAGYAERHRLPLRLVHVYDIPIGYLPGVVAPAAVRESLREQGWRWVRQAAGDAAGRGPELVVERGVAVPALVDQSREAAQVVLGSRGLGGFTGLLVGSTAAALAGRAHCPVLVVRGEPAEPDGPVEVGPVVVGVDGTPAGEAAIAFAFAEASARNAELTAVHTWSEALLETLLVGDTSADYRPSQQQAYEILAERLAGWQEKYPEVTVHREVVRDRPAVALSRYAEHAALVVVGTRGRGGFGGLILGSTSQHLLAHAPCPVAIVRTGAGEGERSSRSAR
jgi:nucleotide-binding universal stress UspA family protein